MKRNNSAHWMVILGMLAVLVMAAGVGSAPAATVSLQAGLEGLPGDIIEEGMLVQESGNDNFGGRTNFETGVLGNGKVRTTVMRFDVTNPALGLYAGGVPKFSAINGLTLTLTTDGNNHNSDNMDLRISTGQDAQGDWVEGAGETAASGGDAGNVTYTERREGQGTGWQPNTNYTRGTGDGLLATVAAWPGTNTSFSMNLSPVAGETLTDLVGRWGSGNNEGVLINDVNRSGFARWFVQSSESTDQAARPKLTIDYTPIPLAAQNLTNTVLADSIKDWQGATPPPHGAWRYGRYPNAAAWAAFQDNTNTEIYGNPLVGSDGRMWNAPGYPQVGEYAIAPSSGDMAVRRWTSDVDGEITIFYDAMRLQNGGNGQTAGVYLNGTPLWTQDLTNAANHYMGQIGVTVSAGDQIDFAVNSKGNQSADWTHFAGRIEAGQPHANPGLLAHWAMNETNDMPIGAPNARPYNRRATVGDWTGNNNHMWTSGTYSNERVPGLIGNALEFHNGPNAYGISNASDIGNGATELTLSMWIKPDGKDNWDGLLTSKAGGFTGIALADYIDDGQTIYSPTFRVMNAGNVTSAIETPDGEWSNVVAVWKSGELHRIYVNGELGAENDAQAFVGAIAMDGDDNWYLGADRLIANRWFDGLIDDAGIWTRALSEYEIQQIYLGGLQGVDLAHADTVDVPEPATLALLAMGLGGLGAYARRRKRR